ncbi:MAG: helix-turn-helix transcriptional regulator [Lachnospiraceae bacterium]|nr:helix-turn-helix transcriptional regulator [Lachnospiraceae bacterium]
MLKFGERLRKLRLQNDYTQKQLAIQLGVAISAVSSYEANIRYPTYESLVKLSKIFNVSTDYLLGIERERSTIDVSDLDENEIRIITSLVNTMRELKNK